MADTNPVKRLMDEYNNPVFKVIELHTKPLVDIGKAFWVAHGDPVKFRLLASQAIVDNLDVPFRTASIMAKPFLAGLVELEKSRLVQAEESATVWPSDDDD